MKTVVVTLNTAFEIHLNFVALELRLLSDITIIQQSLYVRMQSQACCDYLTVNV